MEAEMSDRMRTQARRQHALLLRSLQAVSQKRVAEMIGVSEPTFSNLKNDHLERVVQAIVACGLKLVPTTEHTYDESVVNAIKTLAAIGLGRDLKRDEDIDV
jgi:predicted XRE-type DNA-binding protein